jgi:hypothetical protein
MHDPNAQGEDFFICDFCRRPWRTERPMVEGHKGSLICAPCLGAAYTELVHLHAGTEFIAPNTRARELMREGSDPATAPGATRCALCLEFRAEPYWASPLVDGSFACRRCVRQSTTTLERDPELNWRRPAPPPGAPEPAHTPEPDDEEDDDHDEHGH